MINKQLKERLFIIYEGGLFFKQNLLMNVLKYIGKQTFFILFLTLLVFRNSYI